MKKNSPLYLQPCQDPFENCVIRPLFKNNKPAISRYTGPRYGSHCKRRTDNHKPADAEWLNDGKNDGLQLVTFFLFFVGYISMGAAFVFFMAERNNVAPQYRTTMTISALIVGIAAFHYYYMRGVYVDHQVVSIEYRYMDWIITVPLMALKFPSLVGKDAITDDKFAGMGFTGICFTGALIMIGFGYLGELV